MMGRRILLAATCVWLAGCGREAQRHAQELTGGIPVRGKMALRSYGCISCHTIPDVPGANALVGPPLIHMASRTYVAGVLTNTPEHLQRWIKNPPGVDDKTAMPNLHVTDEDARNIAAYLYTLQ